MVKLGPKCQTKGAPRNEATKTGFHREKGNLIRTKIQLLEPKNGGPGVSKEWGVSGETTRTRVEAQRQIRTNPPKISTKKTGRKCVGQTQRPQGKRVCPVLKGTSPALKKARKNIRG